MPGKIVLGLGLVGFGLFGGLIGAEQVRGASIITFVIAGLGVGLVWVFLLQIWSKTTPLNIIGGSVGAGAGAIIGTIVSFALSPELIKPELNLIIRTSLIALLCLTGLRLGDCASRQFDRAKPDASGERPPVSGVLDTSVLIDGRISDLCETGFLRGSLVLPQFVLQEVQAIADSADGSKRTRGRRGLDIINKMKKQSYVKIIIDDTQYPSIKDVDQKLIQMARDTGYAIITNDFNLNKVAEVHSLQVLNINRLANALKPVVLPGETMKVHITREGREPGQGLAYLDDGTMIVVENGRRSIGRTLDVTVTSVLQTTAVRLIFASIKADGQ
jgi:uncharacterized protein YacL